MTTNIVFENLETQMEYTTIEAFMQAHRGFKMIQRQNLSFEGAEDIDNPLPFILLDGVKIPRYRLSVLLDKKIKFDPLVAFLASKHAFWIISSISLYMEAAGNHVFRTNKVEYFFKNWEDIIWQLATTQIKQRIEASRLMPPPPPQLQMMPVQMPPQPSISFDDAVKSAFPNLFI